MKKLNISDIQKVHFVGIKGVAMTALAILVKERGIEVTGSDVGDIFPTDEELASVDIVPFVGFHAGHIEQTLPDVVIYTGAHSGQENPEVIAAEIRGIPTWSHAQALGFFAADKKQIVVAGCHGKTTTTGMISSILSVSTDPSFAIGSGKVRGVGLSGHFGQGPYFVAEGDEYVTDPKHDKTPRFLWLSPKILVITNVDFDHPDQYNDLDEIVEAYKKLINKLPPDGVLILNADDPKSAVLRTLYPNIVTVGSDPHATYQISHIIHSPGETRFQLMFNDAALNLELHVPGKHNVQNAAMAAAASLEVGIKNIEIVSGLRQFGGAKRRFEEIGTTKLGMKIYDDYAHHPSEIRATLAAARDWYADKRIIAVFQPHTYSRTKALFTEFGEAFADASTVWIANIYASAREQKDESITSQLLVAEIARHHTDVSYMPNITDVLEALSGIYQKNTVLMCLGAGDIFSWGPQILEACS